MSTAAQVAADITKMGFKTRAKVHKVVVTWGYALQKSVKGHASQPRTAMRRSDGAGPIPIQGPRRLTGGYLRTINKTTTSTATTSTTMVGSSDDRARRLEHGFKGTDSKGRVYDQQPYPHFGPGLDDVAPGFRAALAEAVRPDVTG